jgi:hypothetical protein
VLPVCYSLRAFAMAGRLMSYGSNEPDAFTRLVSTLHVSSGEPPFLAEPVHGRKSGTFIFQMGH